MPNDQEFKPLAGVRPRKKKYRRAISLRGSVYRELREYCEARGISMSSYVEMLIGQSAAVRTPPRCPHCELPAGHVAGHHNVTRQNGE